MTTGLVYHPDCLLHDTGSHPESPGRLRAIMGHLDEYGLIKRLDVVTPEEAPEEALLWIHTRQHIDHVRRACAQSIVAIGRGYLDPDTPVCAASWRAALLAAGGVMTGVDHVMAGKWENGMAVVRPPGHHATPDKAMGFCLFNNVAIGARYLQKRYGLKRVAIIDWDVHHGNGTQDAFYADPSVFYLSTHLRHHYPGTGSATETGVRAGEGTTLNIPLPHGVGSETFFREFRVGLAELERFNPEFILVSAGFDSHRDDPLGGLPLTEQDFATLTRDVMNTAQACCSGRLFSTLEGGYNLAPLSRSVAAHLEALLGHGQSWQS